MRPFSQLTAGLLATLAATPLSTAQDPQPPSYNSNARTSPPKGAVLVDAAGEHSNYTTVQAGVDALSTTETGLQNLFIFPGVYHEQVFIAPRAANLTIQGSTSDATTYTGNTVNITQSLSQQDVSGNDATATLRAHAANLKVYNVNLINTFGQAESSGQALALSAQETSQGYYGLGLFGYQDTVYANEGAQLYAACLITGATDFIFGQRGRAWFERTDIRVVDGGWITASGRNSTENESWFVINNGTVAGVDATVEEEQAGSVFLGRPWGVFARVVFQFTRLSAVVDARGWSVWNPPPMERISNVTFAEYANTGPGSDASGEGRADFSQQLVRPITPEELFGCGFEEEWWVDEAYL